MVGKGKGTWKLYALRKMIFFSLLHSPPPPISFYQVLVEYIDYGNEEQLDRLRLRKALDIDLFSLPHQVRCLH